MGDTFEGQVVTKTSNGTVKECLRLWAELGHVGTPFNIADSVASWGSTVCLSDKGVCGTLKVKVERETIGSIKWDQFLRVENTVEHRQAERLSDSLGEFSTKMGLVGITSRAETYCSPILKRLTVHRNVIKPRIVNISLCETIDNSRLGGSINAIKNRVGGMIQSRYCSIAHHIELQVALIYSHVCTSHRWEFDLDVLSGSECRAVLGSDTDLGDPRAHRLAFEISIVKCFREC